jgi:hypothetical protein
MARLASVPDLEAELDRLYGLPPSEFTAARNDLARRLRAAGRTEPAAETAKLVKPSISAWAVNQLSRQRRQELEGLVGLGRELAEAQLGAVAGEEGGRFEELSSKHGEAVRELTGAAAALLTDTGARPSDAVRRRIAGTLRALSLDPTEPNPLLEGRLVEDSETTGFSLIERFDVPARSESRGRAVPRARNRTAELREQLRAARAAVREARSALTAANREAARARREAELKEAAAAAAEAAAGEAAARVDELERELR